MFWVRFRSAVVLVIITLAALIVGNYLLWGILLAVAMIGVRELYKVFKMENSHLGIVGYIAVAAWYTLLLFDLADYGMLLLIAMVMVIMATFVFTYPKYETEQVMASIVGVIYVAMMLSFMYQVGMLEDGFWLVWLIFIGSWISDTAAYCVGVCIGKHKLAPVVSPKKSIEGSVGGIVGSALVGAIYALCIKNKLHMEFNPIIAFTIMGAASSVISQIGDLAASAIKRKHDIKDYGTLIPGHGGVLDRFDSVIFTAPIVYYLATFFM
jgi:phosphatidate cytidylyltransferase